MTSTGCRELAQEVLERCLTGAPPGELPRGLLDEQCGHALFSILVEGLADRFEPALCDAYALLFSRVLPSGDFARYERIRQTRPVDFEPRRVFVLSRITLGADVAVTSVVLSAAKQRFPDAEIVFVGPQKNYELFAGDERIRHAPVQYRRGALRDRLAVWDELRKLLTEPESLVIDPDSRLTQLGLLPVCPEDRYRFFESRAYGGDSPATLSELTSAWVQETLGTAGAKPYVALGPAPSATPCIAISLGVGENPAKRLPDPFEEQLLALLAGTGIPLCIDRGAGGEEAERVSEAVDRSGVRATFWEGSFAGFASIIAGARWYVGYDSAGQHVAAACGVPLVCVFAGFPVRRMFDRWRPTGQNCHVIRVEQPNIGDILDRVARVVSC